MSDTGDDASRWFDRQPDRLIWELEQLAAFGLDAQSQIGRDNGDDPELLVVKTTLRFADEPVEVELVFPFEYPEQPPRPYGGAGLIDRHQNPVTGNFCWTEDEDRTWRPSMSAAEVLDRVQALLEDSAEGEDAVHLGEVDMAEPVTGLIQSGAETVVVPARFFAHDLLVGDGNMQLLRCGGHLFLSRAEGLGQPDPDLVRRYASQATKEDGIWVDLDRAPTADVLESPERLLALLKNEAPLRMQRLRGRLLSPPPPPRKRGRGRRRPTSLWIGMTFLEEGPLRGQERRNWLFTRFTKSGTAFTLEGRADAQALTVAERARRLPELDGLDGTRVLVVGAGSLGAPIALELAKAGVGHLDIVDHDIYDVNNSVRHILPVDCAGAPKAQAVASHLQAISPFTDVNAHRLSVGSDAEARSKLAELVGAADLVIDSTGSPGVGRIVAGHARSQAKPMLCAGLTAGSHGGDVVLSRPNGPCLYCYQLAAEDGLVPAPPAAAPGPGVTPVGCSHPAFSGAGFDAIQLAAETARAAIGVLGVTTYPSSPPDWLVLAFRGEGPSRQAGALSVHPECPYCS